MFEIHTYAAATKFVPDFRDNRERWKDGREFFYSEVLPLNDAEFDQVQKAHQGADDPKAADHKVLETRVTALVNLKITCNDGEVLVPKNGAELLKARSKLDTATFTDLSTKLVRACVNHSVLSAGELKGSGSSSESP